MTLPKKTRGRKMVIDGETYYWRGSYGSLIVTFQNGNTQELDCAAITKVISDAGLPPRHLHHSPGRVRFIIDKMILSKSGKARNNKKSTPSINDPVVGNIYCQASSMALAAQFGSIALTQHNPGGFWVEEGQEGVAVNQEKFIEAAHGENLLLKITRTTSVHEYKVLTKTGKVYTICLLPNVKWKNIFHLVEKK